MRIPLLRGRFFTDRDNAGTPKVAVVDQALIDFYLPNTPDPLGQQISIYGGGKDDALTIAGIIHNIPQQHGWGAQEGPLARLPQISVPAAQRNREFGIRLALGAKADNIIRAAMLPGIKLSIGGIACGIVLSFFATRLLKGLIWGISPADTTTFISLATLLIAVAVFTSLLPALQLVKLDPAQTLRDE